MKRVCPSRMRAYSSATGSLTLSTMSAVPQTSSAVSSRVAPAAAYSSSGIWDPAPALLSTYTSWPCWVSSWTPIGVMATRYSWFLTSFGTPTFIALSCVRERSILLNLWSTRAQGVD